MKKYQKFGFSFGIALAALGTFHLISGGGVTPPLHLIFYIISFVILLIALTFPIILKPLFILFSWLGTGIGYFITALTVAILFYLVITPIGLILRIICRKNFIGKKAKNSYWNVVENQERDYEKQY